MPKTQGYAAASAHQPLAPFSFERRETGPRDVRIEILFCGVCHSDLHQVRNEWGNTNYPCVPGHEIVGRVLEVGGEVKKLAAGDLAGVGVMVDSCRACANCREGLEQFCDEGATLTYNSPDRKTGQITCGGYSKSIVVDEAFVLRVPKNLDPAAVAPLLCAGITTYSPLRHWQVKPGQKVGIVGLGGLGHMGVKLAAAMGAHVVLFTTSPRKKEDGLRLGAKEVVVSKNDDEMMAHANSFDLIIDTVSGEHDLNAYLALLKRDATLVLVGLPEKPVGIEPFALVGRRRSLAGSAIGGVAETQEMLDFCGQHGIVSDIEIIPMAKINEAYERLLKSDVKYRFVIDLNTLRRLSTAMHRVLWLLLGLALGGGAAWADDVTVHIRARAPIETLDPDGHPSGVSMSAVGASFTLVSAKDDQLVLQGADGRKYQIAMNATDYQPPATPAATAPVTTNATAIVTPAPVTTNAAPAAPDESRPMPVTKSTPAATTPAASASAPTSGSGLRERINAAFGVKLLADDHFWDDPVLDVGQRLLWPKESETSTQVSFRKYSNGLPVLGVPAYSLALYGKDGKPTYLSIIFSNAGDFPEVRQLGGGTRTPDDPAVIKVRKDLAEAVKRDAAAITDKLTALLGTPTITLFGNSASNRDEVHRWDWKDVAFLLNSHKGEYASLKIIPTAAADDFGTVAVSDQDTLKEALAKRVVKRDNGDVVLSDVPMVDQGPKGYCVPATWERYLRYMDIPADLYVLAILGDSGLGGGTSVEGIRAGVDDYVSAYHRRIEVLNVPLDVDHVAKYIDQGLPLMWTCWVTDAGEKEIFQHTAQRRKTTDWDAYATATAADDKERETKEPTAESSGHDNGHMRMIIGYNAKTNELAISDSWGPVGIERWITVKEADDISQGDLEYVRW